MDIALTLLPIAFIIIIAFGLPTSLEKTNSTRSAKGKPTLTEAEFERKVKRERIIAVAIVTACVVIPMIVRAIID